MWLGAQQGRIDQDCLVVRSRDGGYYPQDRTTSGNRREFRYALFYEHLAGPDSVLLWKPISLSVTPAQPLPDNRWGWDRMIQLSSLAPVLAANPSFALRGAEIELSERTAHVAGRKLPILIAKLPISESWELWVDPESNHRIVRCLCRDDDGDTTGQIDIAYDEHPPGLPVSWTVQDFDHAGYVLDFLSARVSSAEYSLDVPDQYLAAAPLDGGLNPRRAVQAEPVKNVVRRVIGRPLIPSMVLCLLAILAAAKKSQLGRRIAVLLVMMAIGVVWLGHLPFLETPLRPIYTELSMIAEQARAESLDPSDQQPQASHYSSQQQQRLESLSQILSSSYRTRLGSSLWGRWVGRNDADEKARLELLQLAQHDLPSLLKNDGNSAARLELITERLQRIDQHLAGDGRSSPYIQPIPISYKIGDPRLKGD
ncbi:MAG: hypothetical protein ACF788_06680 [Novipirellula sp. JB048]